MTDHVAVFGIVRRPEGIAWPEATTRDLTARSDWERRRIHLSIKEGRFADREIDAMCRGEFAVHAMVDDPGFTMTVLPSGFRLYWGGRVFANCDAAMRMAEQAMSLNDDWNGFVTGTKTVHYDVREAMRKLHEEAERRGEILGNLVY